MRYTSKSAKTQRRGLRTGNRTATRRQGAERGCSAPTMSRENETMPAEIRVAAMRQKIVETENTMVLNACSNSKEAWQSDLSPFLLGPCPLYGNHVSLNMENGWQYSKLYHLHADDNSDSTTDPTPAYWAWAEQGWNNPKAVRYPMGRGARPLCSLWDGKKYLYIEARKMIYGPLYRDAVIKTEGFKKLQKLHEEFKGTIYLRDFDGYDEVEKGMNLSEVIENPKRKMGHAFVVKMLLTDSAALKLFRS